MVNHVLKQESDAITMGFMIGRKIAQKKLTTGQKKSLQILMEEFLERDQASIIRRLKNRSEEASNMIARLHSLLLNKMFWMDELDQQDFKDGDSLHVLCSWHRLLKPVWNQVKKSLFNYKKEISPARAAWRRNRGQPPPPEWEGLLPYEPSEMLDKYYRINLRSGAMSHVTLCFDAGRIDVHNRDYRIKVNFLEMLKGLPISLFSNCKHCGNCIVITKKKKEYCPGCAAKAYQKEKWLMDPDRLRAKERLRYDKKRKKQSSKSSPLH